MICLVAACSNTEGLCASSIPRSMIELHRVIPLTGAGACWREAEQAREVWTSLESCFAYCHTSVVFISFANCITTLVNVNINLQQHRVGGRREGVHGKYLICDVVFVLILCLFICTHRHEKQTSYDDIARVERTETNVIHSIYALY